MSWVKPRNHLAFQQVIFDTIDWCEWLPRDFNCKVYWILQLKKSCYLRQHKTCLKAQDEWLAIAKFTTFPFYSVTFGSGEDCRQAHLRHMHLGWLAIRIVRDYSSCRKTTYYMKHMIMATVLFGSLLGFIL